MRRVLGVVLAASCLALGQLRADLPGPGPRPPRPPFGPVSPDQPVQPQPPPVGRVVLEVVAEGVPSRLRLPVGVQAQFRADTGQPGEPRRVARVFAGSALVLSLAFTGLWLVRARGPRGGRLLLGLLVCGLLGSVAGCWIDRGPSGQQRLPLPIVMQPNGTLAGEALLEISDSDNVVTLTLERQALARLLNPPPATPATP
jgi:hypothetical protein